MWYSSANRDEDKFDNPWRFDVTRNPNPQIGYGAGGAHFCLGANLARREIRVRTRNCTAGSRRRRHRGAGDTAFGIHPRHQAASGGLDALIPLAVWRRAVPGSRVGSDGLSHPPRRAHQPAGGRTGELLATPQPDPFAEELVLVPGAGDRALALSAAVASAGSRRRRRRGVRGGVISIAAVVDRRNHRHRRRRSVVAGRHGVAAAGGHRRLGSTSRGAGPWPRTWAVSTTATRPSCAGAGGMRWPGESPGCSRHMQRSARTAGRLAGRRLTDGQADRWTRICPGSRNYGARWWPASVSSHPTSGTQRAWRGSARRHRPARTVVAVRAHPADEHRYRTAGRAGHAPRPASVAAAPERALWPASPPNRTTRARGAPGPDRSHLAARHPLLATLGRDVRELQRALPAERPTDENTVTK